MPFLEYVLLYNRFISRVSVRDSGSVATVDLGLALEANKDTNIQVFDISGSNVKGDAELVLARAMSTFNHCIPVIDISNTSMSSKGVAAFIKGLEINSGMSLGLESLNISNIPLGQDAASALNELFRNIRVHDPALKRFSASYNNLYIGPMCVAIEEVPLTYIDFSGNRFDIRTDVDDFVRIARGTKVLQVYYIFHF